MSDDVLVTLDVDWSPDWIIDEVRGLLQRDGVRATWFVTHDAPAIRRLRAEPGCFELGLHPNCLPGSTQGGSEREVLANLKAIVPEAVSMRMHGLYQTSAFLRLAARDYGIRFDSTIFLPETPHITPHALRCGGAVLWRIPFFWEDDVTMVDPAPDWHVAESALADPGLKIFAFHPFHVVLNTVDYGLYERLKAQAPLNRWTPALVDPQRHDGPGPRTVFLDLLRHLARRGGGRRLSDLVPPGAAGGGNARRAVS